MQTNLITADQWFLGVGERQKLGNDDCLSFWIVLMVYTYAKT